MEAAEIVGFFLGTKGGEIWVVVVVGGGSRGGVTVCAWTGTGKMRQCYVYRSYEVEI